MAITLTLTALALPTAAADGPLFCSGTISLNCGPGAGCDNNPVACVVEEVQDFVHGFKICELRWQECLLGSLYECIGLNLCS